MVARAVAGVAGERLGLLRAIFLEVTSGSETALSGIRPVFTASLAVLADYMAAQMAAGRVRQMHPVIALQVVHRSDLLPPPDTARNGAHGPTRDVT